MLSGVYRRDIPVTVINNNTVRESVYVGLYATDYNNLVLGFAILYLHHT